MALNRVPLAGGTTDATTRAQKPDEGQLKQFSSFTSTT
jgi:hypothetical protein